MSPSIFLFVFGIFVILHVCMCIQPDAKVFHYTFHRFMPNNVAIKKVTAQTPVAVLRNISFNRNENFK